MSKFKELKSIELGSFTTISAGIAVLFSIISAILFSILAIALIPNGANFAIYLIPTIIVGSFMLSIYSAFSEGLFYNLLAKKLKTVAIELNDNEIVKISTTETAMMVSIILTIQVILLYLVSLFTLPILLTSIIQTLTYSGQQMAAYSIYQLLIVLSQPATIGIIIFGTFIISFVFVLIGTYIYNILGKNGKGAVLNLSTENSMTSIDSIDSLKLAIAFAIISGILNLILAIIMMISGAPITTAIGNVIGGFVGGFIEAYLVGLFYNFLAPKLGKLKIELIDFKI
jgi:hypothetical protein